MDSKLSTWKGPSKGAFCCPGEAAGGASGKLYSDYGTLAWGEPVYSGLPIVNDKDLVNNNVSAVNLGSASLSTVCDEPSIIGTGQYIQYNAADMPIFSGSDFNDGICAILFNGKFSGGSAELIRFVYGSYYILIRLYLSTYHYLSCDCKYSFTRVVKKQLPISSCSKIMYLMDKSGATRTGRLFINGTQVATIDLTSNIPSTGFSALYVKSSPNTSNAYCKPRLYTGCTTGFPGLGGAAYNPDEWS